MPGFLYFAYERSSFFGFQKICPPLVTGSGAWCIVLVPGAGIIRMGAVQHHGACGDERRPCGYPVDIRLHDASAPRTVANFLAYVRGGAFNGSLFHRLLPGFALQGGVHKRTPTLVAQMNSIS